MNKKQEKIFGTSAVASAAYRVYSAIIISLRNYRATVLRIAHNTSSLSSCFPVICGSPGGCTGDQVVHSNNKAAVMTINSTTSGSSPSNNRASPSANQATQIEDSLQSTCRHVTILLCIIHTYTCTYIHNKHYVIQKMILQYHKSLSMTSMMLSQCPISCPSLRHPRSCLMC